MMLRGLFALLFTLSLITSHSSLAVNPSVERPSDERNARAC